MVFEEERFVFQGLENYGKKGENRVKVEGVCFFFFVVLGRDLRWRVLVLQFQLEGGGMDGGLVFQVGGLKIRGYGSVEWGGVWQWFGVGIKRVLYGGIL